MEGVKLFGCFACEGTGVPEIPRGIGVDVFALGSAVKAGVVDGGIEVDACRFGCLN